MNQIINLKNRIEKLPEAERDAAERQVLADFARTSAYARPVGNAGSVACFALANVLEVEALKHDADIAIIQNRKQWKAFIATPKPSMALLTKSSGITSAVALGEFGAFSRPVNLFCE